ncbi:MAG: hypothetical protein ACRCX2_33695 [Paraclostridium sp.]
MDKLVYIKKNFLIDKVSNGYIVININKDFKCGHTHLKSFKASKTAIDLVLNRKIPRSTNFYYLESLIRLSDDEIYIKKLNELIETRKRKGKKLDYVIKK